jgi:hypothetical protein
MARLRRSEASSSISNTLFSFILFSLKMISWVLQFTRFLGSITCAKFENPYWIRVWMARPSFPF